MESGFFSKSWKTIKDMNRIRFWLLGDEFALIFDKKRRQMKRTRELIIYYNATILDFLTDEHYFGKYMT